MAKESVVEAPDLSALTETHANKWVALSPDYKHVLAYGDDLKEVDRQVAGKRAIFTRILPKDVNFSS